MYTLYELMVSMNDKYNVHDFFRNNYGQELTTQDLPELAGALKTSLQAILKKVDQEVEGFSKLLAMKERELSLLRAQSHQQQNTAISTSLTETPSKSASAKPLFTPNSVDNRNITPSREGQATGRLLSSTKSPAVSTAAKEAARYHSELIKEVSCLHDVFLFFLKLRAFKKYLFLPLHESLEKEIECASR